MSEALDLDLSGTEIEDQWALLLIEEALWVLPKEDGKNANILLKTSVVGGTDDGFKIDLWVQQGATQMFKKNTLKMLVAVCGEWPQGTKLETETTEGSNGKTKIKLPQLTSKYVGAYLVTNDFGIQAKLNSWVPEEEVASRLEARQDF